MSSLRATIILFIVYIVLSIGTGWYSFTNPYFQSQTFQSTLTDKWTESYNKNRYVRLIGRFEGVDQGEKFKYDVTIGEYTYKHVPFGTPHTFKARPYDVHRDSTKFILQVFATLFSAASGLMGIIFGFVVGAELYRRNKKRKDK